MKLKRAGSIINMSSRAGIVGIPTLASYCAQQGYQIRCNSIHPGAILTPMWDPLLGDGGQREQSIQAIATQVPLGRMGTAIDVANAALYLASDESAYVTGVELHIDGGILAGSVASPPRSRDRGR